MNLDGVDGIEVLPGVHLPPAKGGLGAFEKVIHLAQPQSRGGGSTDESGGGGVGAGVVRKEPVVAFRVGSAVAQPGAAQHIPKRVVAGG